MLKKSLKLLFQIHMEKLNCISFSKCIGVFLVIIHHAWQTVYNRIIRVRQKVVRIYFYVYDGVWVEGRFAVLSN